MKGSRGASGIRHVGLFFKHVLRKIFLEDWLLKLTALLITLTLWYGVTVSSKKGTATFVAQLFIHPSGDAVVMNQSRDEVRISVSGNDQLIGDLYGRKDLNVTADLTQAPNGERNVQLTPQTVLTNLPSDIKLEDIQPRTISVTLERLVEKDVPVEAAITGEPAAGYEVYSTTVSPARSRVSGPESFMDTLNSVPTGAVDISGAKGNVTSRQLPISINNPRVTIISDSIVDVTVTIGERRIERTMMLTSSNKRVSAVFYGPRSAVSKLKPSDIKVEIVKGDNGEDVPRLTLPDNTIEIRSVKIAH